MTKEIIVVHESVGASVRKDIFAIGSITGMIALGVYLDSSAMQWAGFIFGALQIAGVVRRATTEGVTTPQKAANMIRDKWGVVAEPKP